MQDINPDIDDLPMTMPELTSAPVPEQLLDPATAVAAVALAAAVAAIAVLAGGMLLRLRPSSLAQKCAHIGCLIGVGAGFLLGCYWLDLLPSWPPAQDRGRFLLLVWPAVLLVEIVSVLIPRPRWIGWVLRAVVTAAVGHVLLDGSHFAGEKAWPMWQAGLILGGLAAGLLVEWFLLTLLVERTSGPSIPISLAFTCGCAGALTMLHGYITGGLLGLPVAAALAGAAIASAFVPGRLANGLIGPGVVGLFGVLVMGYFSGSLAAGRAIVLFAAPLLGWLVELPREMVRVVIVMFGVACGAAIALKPEIWVLLLER